MASTDKNSRRYAVPVRGTIWGMNYNDRTERDIGHFEYSGGLFIYSDYNDYFPGEGVDPVIGASQQCPLRILLPHYGGLEECYADLQITVASVDSDLQLRVAVGRLDPANYDRITTYTEDEIAASWRKISGSDAPLTVNSGIISSDLINLLPGLYKYGDTNYRRDVFVLLLVFNKVPTVTGTFKFNWLNMHTSVSGVS